MFAVIRMAVKDLKSRWVLALVMALLFSITFASYLALITYQKSLSATYFSLEANWLVVQESYGSGEIHGSRLTNDIGQLLIDKGYDHPIPEIHQVVGTSLANGIMLRGVDPEDLYKISPFTLLSGRALEAGDSPRLAMIGQSLADRLRIEIGEVIKLRGREFTVVGIFKTGSYEDSQAWISLLDAQKLLNYGTDVSTYFIPDGGSVFEGDTIAKGISVGRRGDSGNTFGNEAMNFFNYLGLIGGFSGVATLITLINLLWRLTWLHRREFGIMRTIGFRRNSVVLYLSTQTFFILSTGAIIGGIFAILVVISRIKDFSAFGIGLSPTWDINTIGITTLVTLVIAGIGIAMPAKKIYTMTTIELLGRD
jgi:putative ABC transport system permease protein